MQWEKRTSAKEAQSITSLYCIAPHDPSNTTSPSMASNTDGSKMALFLNVHTRLRGSSMPKTFSVCDRANDESFRVVRYRKNTVVPIGTTCAM